MIEQGYKIISTLRSGGRVTIPEEIRETLALEDGDKVELIILRKVEKK